MVGENNQDYGQELLSWEIKEHHEHARGLAWAVIAGLTGVALLIYAVSTRNFLFAFIVIMFGIIFATHSLRPAGAYRFSIFERGLCLGERFYPWKDFDHFWIVDTPPAVRTVYLEFGGLRPRLPIPLGRTSAATVRDLLGRNLREDTEKTEEPMSDFIARMLKI